MNIKDATNLIARNGHSHCLLCGNLHPKSLNLSFQAEENGGVKARFTAKDDLQGYEGILHGGVIAALLDEAMTHCLFHRGIRAYTGDLRVRFVQPVACNASLKIKARILSSRPPFYLLKGEITVDKNIVAWSEAKFMQRPIP
ncbi:MAG: PaaI family thioesterase [Desulfobacteraceae bacterium]|nr:MAG: PaaI family thioesterase [Desulfobacteraceae bacterium]